MIESRLILAAKDGAARAAAANDFVGIETTNEGSNGLIGAITVNVDFPMSVTFYSNNPGTSFRVAWNRSIGL